MSISRERRLEQLEDSLAPEEMFNLWLADAKRFDSLSEYLSWAVQDWPSRGLEPRLRQQAKRRLEGRSDGAYGEREMLRISHKHSRVLFLERLVWELNSEAEQVVRRCRGWLQTTSAILDLVRHFHGELGAGNVGAVEGSAAAAAEGTPKTVADYVGMARTVTSDAVVDLKAIRLAVQCISNKRLEGQEPLFESVALAMDELGEWALACVEAYNQLVDRAAQTRAWPSTELPASIDCRELERTAQDRADATARKLVNFAKADVLLARDQVVRALEQLRPHLSDSRPVRE